MFGVAALGVSVVVGYSLYKYVQGKQNARRIKEAVDEMVRMLNFHHFLAPIYLSLYVHFVLYFCASNCAKKIIKSPLLVCHYFWSYFVCLV